MTNRAGQEWPDGVTVSIGLTKPCLECGKEQPVSEHEYNQRLYFPLCHSCRVKAAQR